MSLKTLSILFIKQNLHQTESETHILNHLITELCENFELLQITNVTNDSNVITRELDAIYKHSDIVITIGGLRDGKIHETFANLTGQGTIDFGRDINFPSTEWCTKMAKSTKIIRKTDTFPLVYLNQIFMLDETHATETFNAILKPILGQYARKLKLQRKAAILNENSLPTIIREQKFVCLERSLNDEFLEVTVNSPNFPELFEAEAKFPALSFRTNFSEFPDIYASEDPTLIATIQIVENALERYRPENVFVCFNGGKDCTVLLHVIQAVCREKFPNCQKLHCLYVQSEEPFEQQEIFIENCKEFYALEISRLRMDVKAALREILAKNPHYTACFMGTRRTDPFSEKLTNFQLTDSDWPEIMRISPLLDWHLSDIWNFLLYYKIPYCELYDMGFTSLGSAKNTHKNQFLKYTEIGTTKEKFLPAYKLLNENRERSGRDSNKS